MPTRGDGPGDDDELEVRSGHLADLETDEAEVYEKTMTFDEIPETDNAFDFDVFEQTEAEAAKEARQRAERRAAADETSEPVRRPRAVVPRSYLPLGDVIVETRPLGSMTIVTLRGRINESFDGKELGDALRGAVLFDLSEVDRVSSFGVRGWLQMMQHARLTDCYYYRCSEAFVNQMTMMRNFAGSGLVHSLLAPYTCSSCGEEFSAVYEAVADRERLLGRSAEVVPCPRCGTATEMADDPWTYFNLDSHLLAREPDELEQVIEHMTSDRRVDPVEKFISSRATHIRFNAPIDGKLRLRRVFTGLEGEVVLDLLITPEVDEEGEASLRQVLEALEAEVRSVAIEGAPASLLRSLLDRPIDRVRVASVFVDAHCPANGIRRPVLVEIERRRAALLDGRLPPIDAGWATGPLEIDDQQLLFDAAQQHAAATPQPPPTATPQGAPTPAPTPAAPQPGASGHTAATAPPAPAAQAPSGALRNLAPFLVATATIAIVAATIILVGGAVMLGENPLALGAQTPPPPPPEPTPAAVEEGWNGESALPPPWVEQGFVLDEDTYYVVGMASDVDVRSAAERSRTLAVHQLLMALRDRIDGPAAATRSAGTVAPEVAVERFSDGVGTWASVTRVDSAIKREDGQVTVATRHALEAAVWQRLRQYYGEVVDFRGLGVVRRFPTDDHPTPVVVATAESWMGGVAAGDPVLTVDGVEVENVGRFREVTEQAWDDLAPGRSMTIRIEHRGEPKEVRYSKPASRGIKQPARPRLERALPSNPER